MQMDRGLHAARIHHHCR